MSRGTKTTLLHQFLRFFVPATVIPVLVLFVLLFLHMDRMTKEEIALSRQQAAELYGQAAERRLSRLRASLRSIAGDLPIQQALADPKGDVIGRGERISEEIVRLLNLNEGNGNVHTMLYAADGLAPVFGRCVAGAEQARKTVWYDEKKVREAGHFILRAEDGGTAALLLCEPVYSVDLAAYRRTYLGVVTAELPLDEWLRPLPGANYDVDVRDERGLVYLSSSSSRFGEAGAGAGKPSGGPSGKTNGTKKAAEAEAEGLSPDLSSLASVGLKISFFFHGNGSEWFPRSQMMRGEALAVWAAMTVAALACVVLYGRRLSRRIEGLTARLEPLSEEERRRRGDAIEADGTPHSGEEPAARSLRSVAGEVFSGKMSRDEIDRLDERLSRLVSERNRLVEQEYRLALETKEMRLRNLRLQIQPHFLYNTLETISSLAAIRNAFEICEMCSKLGEIFRYSLGKGRGEWVRLSEEWRHAENYLYLHKMRAPERFEIVRATDLSPENFKVPCFILQPVLENAMSHGMRGRKTTGLIELSAGTDGETLCLCVADDGPGMTPERLDAVRLGLEQNDTGKGEGIGLSNVHQRIRLLCGEGYGLNIESRPGLGCRVEFRLPILREDS